MIGSGEGGLELWPELVGPLLAGVAGLVTAIAGLLTARARGISESLKRCEETRMKLETEAEEYQRVALLALRHIFRLERALASRGHAPPERPEDLRS